MMYHVHIMASISRKLYIWVTNNLTQRVWQHKNAVGSQSCKKYAITKLVYAEPYEQIEFTIKREKELKGWTRNKKINLIESVNSNWRSIDNL